MSEMKDSGIEWIGKIPKDWDVQKVKFHLQRKEPRNPGNQQVLSVYREYGVIPKDSRDDNHNVTSEDTSNYKYIKPDNFVINKMKAWQGSMGVSEYEGIVSPAYFVYSFMGNALYPKYLHYLFRNCYKDEFRRISGGIREGQWDLSPDAFANTLLLLPSFAEQQKITSALENKCAEIDSLHTDIGKQIDVLEQYKKSVITEAVTNGLDPTVEVKDSGIEWIGKIPKSWNIIRLKFVLKERNVRSVDGSGELLSVSQNRGVVPANSIQRTMQAKSLVGYKIVHVNDLVFNKLNPVLARFGVSVYNGITSPDFSVYYSDKTNVKFLCYLLKTDAYITEYGRICTGVGDGFSRLYTHMLYNIFVALPDIVEQKIIVDYLDSKCAEINSAIADRKKQLETLEAYKKSLIYEYVTGKKEVPV